MSASDRPLLPGSAPPLLVGRERELTLLREHLTAALAGDGSLVLVGGEAGIGKSALAERLGQEATERGALVLVGRCYDALAMPYGPWVEALGSYRPTTDGPPLPVAFAQRGTVGEVASQAALLQQVRDFFTALTTPQPVVLLLEDLHWADPGSLDVLRFVARAVAPLPLLLLVTYRSDEVDRTQPLAALLPALVREAGAARLDLRPLDDAAARALVDVRYRLAYTDAERLLAYLHVRAEGNALFLGELLRDLEESGVLRCVDGGWRLGPLTATPVPPLLRQVIDARVARLGDETQRLLAVAAVVGQAVGYALWAAVAGVDEETLFAAVSAAEAPRIMTESADGTGAVFTHALLREAVYVSVRPSQRRRWHRAVGEALAAMLPPDPDAVADHFQQGGDARAATWLVQAGMRAQRAYAFLTATARYEAALAQMEPEGAAGQERAWVVYLLATMYYYTAPEKGVATLNDAIAAATTAGDRALTALARFQRGLLRNDSFQARYDDLVSAIGVLETLPECDIARIRRYLGPQYSPDADRAALVRILANLGRFAEAQPFAARLVGEGQDPRTYPYGMGAYALMLQAALRGDPASARRWATAARTALRTSGMLIPLLVVIQREIEVIHLAYAADEPGAATRLLREAEETEGQASDSGFVGIFAATALPVLLLEGAWDTAQARAAALLPGSVRGGDYLAITGARWLAVLASWRGEHEAAAAYRAMVPPAGAEREPGEAHFLEAVAMQRLAARVALEVGDLATARRWLEAHDRWLAWSGAVLYQSEGQALWAQYHRQAGDMDTAREHAERALAHATQPRQPLARVAAHRLLGELDTEAGRYDDAAGHLAASLTLATACESPYEQALTLLALADVRAATGERDEAGRLLEQIRAICEPLGARPTLERAAALAARIASAPQYAAAYPAGLSSREVEVLRLVAQGLTNPQVAERLYLSPRTVEQHLRSIYNKLGVSTRAAATHFAVSHHLA